MCPTKLICWAHSLSILFLYDRFLCVSAVSFYTMESRRQSRGNGPGSSCHEVMEHTFIVWFVWFLILRTQYENYVLPRDQLWWIAHQTWMKYVKNTWNSPSKMSCVVLGNNVHRFKHSYRVYFGSHIICPILPELFPCMFENNLSCFTTSPVGLMSHSVYPTE